MSTRGNRQLDENILIFLEAVADIDKPDGVTKIMQAVYESAITQTEHKNNKPLAKLNRSFGQLRRQHPEILNELSTWLKSQSVEAKMTNGLFNASWHRWCEATAKLQTGETATQAFGINGRGKSYKFTNYDDAAIYAEYLHQVEGMKTDAATTAVMTMFGDKELDKREIQRKRRQLKAAGFSPKDLNIIDIIKVKIQHKQYE